MNYKLKALILVLGAVLLLGIVYFGVHFVQYGYPGKMSLIKDCKQRLVRSGGAYDLLDMVNHGAAPQRYVAAKGISNYSKYYMLISEYPNGYWLYWRALVGEPMSKELSFNEGKRLMDQLIGENGEYKSFKSRYNKMQIHNICDFVRIYDGKYAVTIEYLNSYNDYGESREEKVMGVLQLELAKLIEESGILDPNRGAYTRDSRDNLVYAEKKVLKNTFFELDEKFGVKNR